MSIFSAVQAIIIKKTQRRLDHKKKEARDHPLKPKKKRS